ncbi:MAG: hypothetical protein NWE94_04210 [Candidatus Bathyarchaeota archaeon]|nr:hypothetical protein [Candidatus Bathyarchaeota archaeon]
MNKSSVLLLVLICLVAPCVALFLPVKAVSNTLVVPDDYSTIGDAIRAASEGDLIIVKKGTYQEQTLIIDKPLSLEGAGAEETIITFHPPLVFAGWHSVVPMYTYDKPLRIYAENVEISGFTLSAELTTEAPADLANHTLGPCDPPFIAVGGAQILSTGNNTIIRRNTIKTGLSIEGSYQAIVENTLASGVGCYGSNNKIVSNLVTGSGIEVGGFSNQILANAIVGAYKIHSGIQVNGDANIIAGNNVTNCNAGLTVYRGYSGVGSNNVFYGNRLTKNVYGIAVSGGNNNTFFGNELLNNSIGVKIEPAILDSDQLETNATFHHNNFIGSIQQVSLLTCAVVFFDANGEGNYWSDYTSLDGDGDGIGDTPYIINGNLRDNKPLMTPYDISKAALSDAFPDTAMVNPLSTVPLVIVVLAAAVVIGAGLLVCLKKRGRSLIT